MMTLVGIKGKQTSDVCLGGTTKDLIKANKKVFEVCWGRIAPSTATSGCSRLPARHVLLDLESGSVQLSCW